MNLRTPLLAAASLAAISALAFAYQNLAVKKEANNIVSARIEGVWKVDATLSQRLDPDAKTPKHKTLEFHYNEGVLPGLTAAMPRFANRQIFSAGVANVDGGSFTYILTNDAGNMSITWFAHDDAGKITTEQSYAVQVAVGKTERQDLLFLGGNAPRSASLAFTRGTTTDAGAPK